MAAFEHHRSVCPDCGADLVHLAGDPSVRYEEIDPVEGGPRTLTEHTGERCQFHQFLTPNPANHTLPGNAAWLDKSPVSGAGRSRFIRWIRTDQND